MVLKAVGRGEHFLAGVKVALEGPAVLLLAAAPFPEILDVHVYVGRDDGGGEREFAADLLFQLLVRNFPVGAPGLLQLLQAVVGLAGRHGVLEVLPAEPHHLVQAVLAPLVLAPVVRLPLLQRVQLLVAAGGVLEVEVVEELLLLLLRVSGEQVVREVALHLPPLDLVPLVRVRHPL